jgi:hypothetical protein
MAVELAANCAQPQELTGLTGDSVESQVRGAVRTVLPTCWVSRGMIPMSTSSMPHVAVPSA